MRCGKSGAREKFAALPTPIAHSQRSGARTECRFIRVVGTPPEATTRRRQRQRRAGAFPVTTVDADSEQPRSAVERFKEGGGRLGDAKGDGKRDGRQALAEERNTYPAGERPGACASSASSGLTTPSQQPGQMPWLNLAPECRAT